MFQTIAKCKLNEIMFFNKTIKAWSSIVVWVYTLVEYQVRELQNNKIMPTLQISNNNHVHKKSQILLHA